MKVQPKFLNSTEATELIYGRPPTILSSADFRDYQNWMADKIEELPGVLLGAEMGLGKTAATLKAIVRLLAKKEIRKVLIIAPLRVAEETWPAEIAKWWFCRHLTFRVVTGTEDERKAALQLPADITITNRENLRWLLRGIGVRRWPFDMIVYDEASRLKSGRTKTVPQARKDGSMPAAKITELGAIKTIRHRTKKIALLSGTPSPNGIIDIWGPIYAIDEGARLGTSITAYRDRWFVENTYTRRWEPFEHSEGQIMERVKDVFFSLREADYLTLPPMVERDHYVSLTPKELKRYKDFEREMAIEVRNGAGDREIIEAVNNGVLTGKLLQFANGSIYTSQKEAIKIHEHKLDVLDSIMEEAFGQPVLVAYSFQFDKEAIKKRFPYVRVFGDSPNDMRDWNAGKIRMLLTHPASAGHGLNFQHGSNIAVWYGLTWSLELYRQFIKRLHRSGQKADKVFLHRIMARKTADESILPVLLQRGATQDRITDAVRVRLERAIRP